jgi:hypothetical protein
MDWFLTALPFALFFIGLFGLCALAAVHSRTEPTDEWKDICHRNGIDYK